MKHSSIWLGVASLLMATSAFAGGESMVTVDLGQGVTLQAPDDVMQVPEQGVDSIVGSFAGAGFTCQYDHGLYSNDLKSVEGATEQSVDLNGVAARLVAALPDFDGLHVPEIAKTVIGTRRLTITCRSSDDAARQVVRGILHSLQVSPTE